MHYIYNENNECVGESDSADIALPSDSWQYSNEAPTLPSLPTAAEGSHLPEPIVFVGSPLFLRVKEAAKTNPEVAIEFTVAIAAEQQRNQELLQSTIDTLSKLVPDNETKPRRTTAAKRNATVPGGAG